MSLSRILKTLGLGRSRSAQPSTRSLALEVLEERWVPATLKVGHGETYATIQAALAKANNGDTIAVYQGTYTVGTTASPGGLQLTQSNLTLEAEGWNVEIEASSSLADDAMIDVTGTKDRIDGFTIDGDGNQSESIDAAIEITHGGSATVSDNVIQNLFNPALVGFSGDRVGTGIRVGDSSLAAGEQTGTATILNNIIQNYYKAGVTVDATGSSATIIGNAITGVGPISSTSTQQYGVAIVNGAGGTIIGNEIDNNTYDGAIRAGGVVVSETTSPVVIANNYFSGDQDGVILSFSSNTLVSGNTIRGGAADGILLLNANNNTIVANYLDHNGYDVPSVSGPGGGITIYDSSYNQISGNIVTGSNLDAFYLDGSNGGTNFTVSDAVGNDIYGNTFQNSATGNGVNLYYASNNTLTNNLISNNSQNGVMIQGGSGNAVRASTIIGNGVDGVQFLDTASSSVEFSVVAFNDGYGAAVSNSTGTTISYNLFGRNTGGTISVDTQSTGTTKTDNTTVNGLPGHGEPFGYGFFQFGCGFFQFGW
jgi:parallel beta-helix repeat protein